MKKQRQLIGFLGAVTLFGFTAMALLIRFLFSQEPVFDLFLKGAPLILQVAAGLGFGFTIGLLAISLLHIPPFSELENYFTKLLQNLDLKVHHWILLSLCAGIGEEALFRGAIQEFLGIWLTAVLFILLHGYFFFNNLPMLVFSVLMVIFSAGFGYLYELSGFWAAASAHFLYDVMMFWQMNRSLKRLSASSDSNSVE